MGLKRRNIIDHLFYVGVNDREKHLFENYLPLPIGVAYNSYLITDQKTALIDTVDIHFVSRFLQNIDDVLQGNSLDYLIVNHMEPDHAGSIGVLRQKYPTLQIVGNAKTFEMLQGYFGIYDQCIVVKEGDTLSLGNKQLQFYFAPMVHWPEVMVTYLREDKLLFSADAFGTFGTNDGGYMDTALNTDKYWEEMRRYYACIVGKYGVPTQAALKKLSALPIETICATHGPVWRKDLSKVVSLYDKWSRYEAEEEGVVIAYGSMYGNTAQMAEAVCEGVVEGGVKNTVIYNVSQTDSSFILADIFKYNGLIIGSPTYNTEVFPLVEHLVRQIEHRGIKNRIYSCFGSYSWRGNAVKILTDFAQRLQWDIIGNPVENKHALSREKYVLCRELGLAVAGKIKSIIKN
jgi:flavorubredoxin